MDRATTTLHDREAEDAKRRENEVRGGRTAYETVAEKAAALLGDELDETRRKAIGSAIHWTLGASAGCLYGLLRNRIPRLGPGSGLLFGVAFWLAMDEAALTALGVTPPPPAFPWQTHARGLVGHVVLGAAVEVPFDLADAVA
jgi:hypothetical protein